MLSGQVIVFCGDVVQVYAKIQACSPYELPSSMLIPCRYTPKYRHGLCTSSSVYCFLMRTSLFCEMWTIFFRYHSTMTLQRCLTSHLQYFSTGIHLSSLLVSIFSLSRRIFIPFFEIKTLTWQQCRERGRVEIGRGREWTESQGSCNIEWERQDRIWEWQETETESDRHRDWQKGRQRQ